VAERDAIVARANELLDVERWPEFGAAGMQAVGAERVTRLACGVSVTLELVETAAAQGAELLIVHHGLFWRNEPLVVEKRLRGRLEALFRANMTLAAYHLALDAHPELGNAARLAAAIGATPEQTFAVVGVGCRLPGPTPIEGLVTLVRDAVAREPLVFAEGPPTVDRVAIVTGSGGYELIAAALEGYDALVTGEPEEPNLATARELGIHLVAAGHYATERLGVQALTARLAEEFGLPWEFIEVENPV
jgi:dinuclear metal center YbgI/SA1388 family protein